MPSNRTGLATMTKLLEHACRIVTRYGPAAIAAINAAEAGGIITSGDASTAIAFINALQGTCNIFKRVSGY